eukprot:362560-Chlamydomonas_euryale.AAC.5
MRRPRASGWARRPPAMDVQSSVAAPSAASQASHASESRRLLDLGLGSSRCRCCRSTSAASLRGCA